MSPSKAFLALSGGFLCGIIIAHFFALWHLLVVFFVVCVLLFVFAQPDKLFLPLCALVIFGILIGYVRGFVPSPPVPEVAQISTGPQLFYVQQLSRIAGGEPQAMLSAMVLGYTQVLSERTKEVLNITGTRHIVAISGLHMAIVGVIVLKLLIWVGLWRKHAVPATLILLALYVFLVGAPPSAVRAGIMAGLYLGAGQMGRLTQTWRLLIAAAVLMVLVEPHILFEISFQLSFAAVLGIILFKPFFDSLLSWISWGVVRDLVGVSLSAQLTTWPLIAYTFETVSLISPLANLIAVPLLPIVMMLGVGFVLVGWAGTAFAQIFVLPAWVVLKGIFALLEILSRIPYAMITAEGIGVGIVIAYYLLLAYGYRRLATERT